jgi:membrane protein implicated in regulation of membrane protease activity
VLRPYQRANINWETLYWAQSNNATATEPTDRHAGQVRYGGVRWQARGRGSSENGRNSAANRSER